MLAKQSKIDLDRYVGLWHQVASFPAWFQQGCSDVTAMYKKVKDYISVFNSCNTKLGTKSSAFGRAYPSTKNSLKVSFFPLVSADYIIEFVDTGYNYAVVGSQEKKYLWILSRKRAIKPAIYDELVSIAKKKGYDVSRLVKG